MSTWKLSSVCTDVFITCYSAFSCKKKKRTRKNNPYGNDTMSDYFSFLESLVYQLNAFKLINTLYRQWIDLFGSLCDCFKIMPFWACFMKVWYEDSHHTLGVFCKDDWSSTHFEYGTRLLWCIITSIYLPLEPL